MELTTRFSNTGTFLEIEVDEIETDIFKNTKELKEGKKPSISNSKAKVSIKLISLIISSLFNFELSFRYVLYKFSGIS